MLLLLSCVFLRAQNGSKDSYRGKSFASVWDENDKMVEIQCLLRNESHASVSIDTDTTISKLGMTLQMIMLTSLHEPQVANQSIPRQ